jgi:curli production assembly/transport component CsgE
MGAGFAVAALLAAAPLLAADENGQGKRRDSGTLQDIHAGVVTNQTLTFVGQRFYREFVTHWSDKARSDQYSVAIFERPSARWGSLIWVEYANRKVFQTFVAPGRGDMRFLGEQAAEAAYQNVVAADIRRLLIKEPDIGPDEL